MRVAIAGAGNVGLFIANDLHAAGHEVQLIEQNPAVVERAVADEGVEWFIADACEVSSLKEAGLERCDVVVAATGDDEDNLVISLLAKQEFAVPRVIARVNHPKNEWMFNENWGVDLSVSTPHLITAAEELVLGVVHEVPVAILAGDPCEHDAPPRRHARDLAPAEEHPDHAAPPVAHGDLDRGSAGAGHDAHGPDLTRHPRGRTGRDVVHRRDAEPVAVGAERLTIELVDGLGQPLHRLAEGHAGLLLASWLAS